MNPSKEQVIEIGRTKDYISAQSPDFHTPGFECFDSSELPGLFVAQKGKEVFAQENREITQR